MLYFYIIQSDTAKKTSIGHSENPWEKLVSINEDETSKYTGKQTDWKLVALFEVANKEDVISIENFIKKQKSPKLMEKLIDPSFIPAGNLEKLNRISLIKP